MSKRVVVSGIGVVSSIGTGRQAFWEGLISGRSGISRVESFDTSSYDRHLAGEIKNFNPLDFMGKKEAKRMGRASQLAIAATELGLLDAGLNLKKLAPLRVGVIFGTTMGETNVFERVNRLWLEKGLEGVKGFLVLQIPASLIALNVALHWGIRGLNLVIPTACAAGNYALGYGYDLIKEEELDLVIAGGSDAFSRVAFTGFHRLYAMSPDICQPFDRERKGMLLGEGSGVLLLASLEIAQRFSLPIYAEVLGYGLSCDAHHMTIPSEEGIGRCLRNALAETKIKPEEVGYISAHGTGTVQNDKNECRAIMEVFGPYAQRIPISSIKSMLGHCMGAASSLEAISCCLALSEGVLPPTINYFHPDPDCPIDCVPNRARKARVEIALNNAYAFGGNNSCVVFKRYSV